MLSLSSFRETQPWIPCVTGRGRTAESWTRKPSRSVWLQRNCWGRHWPGEVRLTRSYHVSLSLPLKKILSNSCFSFLSPSHTVPGAPAPAKPFDALQDSQLFDAENSEPLSSSGGGCSAGQDRPRHSRSSEVTTRPASPKRRQSNASTQRHRARGTEAAVLYGVMSEDCFPMWMKILHNFFFFSRSAASVDDLYVCEFLRITAAAQTMATLTAPSVPSVLSAPGTVSHQPRVKRKLHRTKKPAPSRLQAASERTLHHSSLSERSTTAPFEVWAAPKLSSRVCHSPSSPARPPCRPATNQLWFLRTSISPMTGWMTI